MLQKILLILAFIAFFGLIIWGVVRTKKVLKKDQDDFKNGNYLK